MKKLLLVIIVLLVGCTSTAAIRQQTVYVNFDAVPSVTVEEEVFVSLDDLEDLNIDILRDSEKHKIYLFESDELMQVSNDRIYNWYIDQGDTGDESQTNCGPSSAVMAALWQNENFSYTVSEARQDFPNEGGWYTSQMAKFFNEHNVTYEVEDYHGVHQLIETINNGHIIVLCIDTTFIEKNDSDEKIGRFYSYEGGHYVVVKGYMYANDALYLEVYDANGWGKEHEDSSPMGKDRLYESGQVNKAIKEWWPHFFIIE